MPYVYSTATNDTLHGHFHKGGADLPIMGRQILIKGGATRGGKGLITPLGVATHVTDEELEYLETTDSFKRHRDRGFLTVVKTKKDPDAVAKDMEDHDKSSPKMVLETTGKKAASGTSEDIAKKVSAKARG